MIGKRSTEHVEHVYTRDPAIDLESGALDFEKFWDTGDWKYLPMREGMTPTVFKLRRLTRRQFMHVLRKSESEQMFEAVAFGLSDVSNFKIGDRELILGFKRSEVDGERLDEPSLDALFAPELFGELAARIVGLSKLSPL